MLQKYTKNIFFSFAGAFIVRQVPVVSKQCESIQGSKVVI